MSDIILTPQGLKKLQAELSELKNERLPDLAKRIAEAKELGDLSENAEYQEAKDEQGFVARRIIEIEQILRSATVADTAKINFTEVEIGNKVEVECDGSTFLYEIVGANEANPAEGKISNDSPLGQAFLGKKKGDEVFVDVPRGKLKYKIMAIK
jgi:transcription elongation factor GreA